MKQLVFLSTALFLLFALNSCSVTVDADKTPVDLSLPAVKDLWKAEKINTWTTEEKTAAGEGRHLTVEIVNSQASGTLGWSFERAKSGAALLSYEACSPEMRKSLIGIRIQPSKEPAVAQVTQNSLFPVKKLDIQAKCKAVIDDIIKARMANDGATISRLTNSEIIPDSVLFGAFATEEVKYGPFQKAVYQGAGEQKTQGNTTYKHFHYLETFENSLARAIYMVSTGPKFELVGMKVDALK